jgi:hypothetical protein
MIGVNVVMAACSSPLDFHTAVAAPCRDPRSGACALAVSQAASVYGSECLGLPISPEVTTLPPFRAYICTRGVTGPLAAQCGMRVNPGTAAAGAAPPPADRATGTAPLALASLLGASATAIGVNAIRKAMFTKKADGDALFQRLDQTREENTQLRKQVRDQGTSVEQQKLQVEELGRQVATSESESETLQNTIRRQKSLLEGQGRRFQSDMLEQEESHEKQLAEQAAQHRKAAEEAEARFATSIAELSNKHQNEMTDLEQSHFEAMEQGKGDHERAIRELGQRHTGAMQQQRRELERRHTEVMSDTLTEQYDALTKDKKSALEELRQKFTEEHQSEIKQHGAEVRESLAAEYEESLVQERARLKSEYDEALVRQQSTSTSALAESEQRAAELHAQLAAQRELTIEHQGKATTLQFEVQRMHSTNERLTAENQELRERLSTHIHPSVRSARAERQGFDMGRFGLGGSRPTGGSAGSRGGPWA